LRPPQDPPACAAPAPACAGACAPPGPGWPRDRPDPRGAPVPRPGRRSAPIVPLATVIGRADRSLTAGPDTCLLRSWGRRRRLRSPMTATVAAPAGAALFAGEGAVAVGVETVECAKHAGFRLGDGHRRRGAPGAPALGGVELGAADHAVLVGVQPLE